MLCCDHHNGYLVCTTRQTRNHPIPDYNRTLQAYPGGRQHYTEVWERNAEAENSRVMACTSNGPNVKVNY